MAKWLRLWGKKRGMRMSGWWVVGSVSEAAFFGALFLLGIITLTIVVLSLVFWPQSSIFGIGSGFWVMVIASASFIVIGLTAFLLQVSQTLASPELRSMMVDKAKREHQRRASNDGPAELPNLPSLRALTDSPGVKLTYRLAVQRGQATPLILSALLSVAWNAMLAVLLVVAIERHLRGTPDWFLTVLLVPFSVVSFFATHWFFRLFRQQSGIGPTAVEIDQMPLLPGKQYKLYVCQYGRATFVRYQVWLVAFEETTYQQGTDIRTERVENQRIPVDLVAVSPTQSVFKGELRAEAEKPMEMHCQFRLPNDIMHSFQGRHNALVWKIEIEGEVSKWPSFCRSFPVVVYPSDGP